MGNKWVVIVGVLQIAAASGLLGCGGASPTPAGADGAACGAGEFAAVRLQHRVRTSIVRIESDAGTTGTGFVIKHQRDGILIATNYHVVRTGKKFDVIFDTGMRLGSIEVVKIDIEQDLALLKAPSLAVPVPGLVLSRQPVALAEHIAAIGYPVVAGESPPSLTFEDGSVTNAATELDGRTYIRTNANINPGNSGGPVIDGCGQVVGVVVATATETKRTGLVIPIDALRTLVAAQETPRATVDAEVAARITLFESAIRYRRGSEVANMFSREMLATHATEAFLASLKHAVATAGERLNEYLTVAATNGKPWRAEGGRIVTNWMALTSEDQIRAMAAVLDGQEKRTFMIALLVSADKIDVQTAMVEWLGPFVQGLFGENPTFKVDRIKSRGRNAAHSEVRVGGGETLQFWQLDWIYEWGDWRIDSFSCERGCN